MQYSSEMNPLAKNILSQKYSHELSDGRKESWEDVAQRVVSNVMKPVGAKRAIQQELIDLISSRKFMPGGRYLAASGRQFHQVQNCLLLRALDSREGWAELCHNVAMALMTGAGIGVDYSEIRPEGRAVRKTGGVATGPIALMQMVNEIGRGIVQGGNRRAAIWAGLKWSHQDVLKFIEAKNWIREVRDLKARDFNFPATLDMTNISVQLDDEFFKAFNNEKHSKHAWAQSVYWATVRQMLKTGEPGFSVDTGANAAETLRNAPVCAETHVLTKMGYCPVEKLVGRPVTIWTGKQWAENVVFKQTGRNVPVVSVRMTGNRVIRCDPSHPFLVERHQGRGKRRHLVSIDRVMAEHLQPGDQIHVSLRPVLLDTELQTEAYTLGYMYGDGTFSESRRGGRARAEITFCAKDSKQCASVAARSDLLSSLTPVDGRGYTRLYFRTDEIFSGRKKSIFPTEVFSWNLNDQVSFLAGLFDADGNHEPHQMRYRLSSVHYQFLRGVSRMLEQLGILSHISGGKTKGSYGINASWQLVVASEYNDDFARLIPTQRLPRDVGDYQSYRPSSVKVVSVVPDGTADVFCADVKVPEHSFMAEGVIVSNCTEVTSADDSDICNLGSINMARIESLDEMKRAVELGTLFLLAGTVYSDVPYAKVDQIRSKNRRLGLGLLGIHEWLLVNGKSYGPDVELDKYLSIYATSGDYAKIWADKWELSVPVKTRAIAPTGTIGIVAETTTGIEPIFCAAYKRRYLKGKEWNYQYVLDPTAQRLIQHGDISPDAIEDAYSLAENVERRVQFQAHVQKFVDHGISSTINLPAWGSELNNDSMVRNFGNMLIQYLPILRGITCYPDGARGGQPLTPVKYKTAEKHIGEVFIEATDVCDLTRGGSCGS